MCRGKKKRQQQQQQQKKETGPDIRQATRASIEPQAADVATPPLEAPEMFDPTGGGPIDLASQKGIPIVTGQKVNKKKLASGTAKLQIRKPRSGGVNTGASNVGVNSPAQSAPAPATKKIK
jgi:hypothetical protein